MGMCGGVNDFSEFAKEGDLKKDLMFKNYAMYVLSRHFSINACGASLKMFSK